MNENIPLFDLKKDYIYHREYIDDAISRVIGSGQFIMGDEVEQLEKEIAGYLGVNHAIGVANGSDALRIALESSLGSWSYSKLGEVLVPAFTFWSTYSAVLQAHLVPRLVDIDPNTYCIDPEKLKTAITRDTKAVIAVHLYGHPAEMEVITGLCEPFGIVVIEDMAQAFGSFYKYNMAGSLGDIGCLSFFPTKPLGCFGDGGMIVTNNDNWEYHARILRSHGWEDKYNPLVLGYNSRLDALQAAIIRAKMLRVENRRWARQAIADHYYASLQATPLVTVHRPDPNVISAYHLFIIEIQEPYRDQFRNRLAKLGIATGIYYPYPIHRTAYYHSRISMVSDLDFPVADKLAKTNLAIPCHPDLTFGEQNYIIKSIHYIADELSK